MRIITLLVSALFAVVTANAQNEKPLLTIGCISDIHTERSLIDCENLDDITVRGSFNMMVNKLRQEEEIDLLLMGGDYTSDATIPYANWERTRQIVTDVARRAFRADATATPVMYITGNHDYEVANWDNIPKSYNASDFYNYPMKQELGELSDDDCFYETADNGELEAQRLLAAYHYKFKGFDFVVLNCGKYFFQSASKYQYSIEAVRWVANKLQQVADGDNQKTIIFGVHVPFADSNSIRSASKGMVVDEASQLLKTTLAKYPNLIMLYGHDHGSDSSYSRVKSSQRITLYDINGNVLPTTDETHFDTEPLGVNPQVEPILRCHLLNTASSSYLGWDTNNLCTVTAPTTVSFIPGSSKFQIHFDEDSNGESLHIGSNGYYSKGSASDLYVYRVTQATAGSIMRGELVTEVVLDENYVLVGEKDGSYYALSNELYNGGSSSQRMTRVKVTLSSDKKRFSLARTDASLIWQPLSAEATSQQVSILSVANGKYLGYNSYNLSTQTAPNTCTITATDPAHYQFTLSVAGGGANSNGTYAYSSTSGRFSANSNQAVTYFYNVIDSGTDSITAVRVRNPGQGGQYIIVAQNAKDNTTYYALTSQDYSSGSSYRLVGLLVPQAPADTIRISAKQTSALWTIGEAPVPEYGEPSFFSAFMGSARHYYNTIDPGDMPIETPNIVQLMMVYIYKDRVEMHMKNVNKTGTFSGITVNPYLQPYVSYRKVQDIDDNITSIQSIQHRVQSPRYNLLGQQVSTQYSGIVIQAGRKELIR